MKRKLKVVNVPAFGPYDLHVFDYYLHRLATSRPVKVMPVKVKATKAARAIAQMRVWD